jgi:vacuolar-type H+-ATPase subunit F/Vma7
VIVAGVAVIGDPVQVQGWALAGARVCPAADAESARQAWASLDPDTAVVLLTGPAAEYLASELAGRNWPLVAVIPV